MGGLFGGSRAPAYAGSGGVLLCGIRFSQPYFSLLGIKPQLGRTFLPDEDPVPQRDALVILSDNFWNRRFGRDPAIIGRTISSMAAPTRVAPAPRHYPVPGP